MFKIILSLISCLILSNTQAEDSSNFEKAPHPGCTDYSYCTEKFGKLNIIFNEKLKKDYFSTEIKLEVLNLFGKRDGYPISIWRKTVIDENFPIIAWDSFCRHHQGKNILIGEIFIKHIKDLKQKDGNYIDYGYVLRGKRVIKYPIPAKKIPLFIDNNKSYFAIERTGKYFNLSVSIKGKIRFINLNKFKKFPQHTNCPENLIQIWKRENHDKEIYQENHCKLIWNRETKKRETILLLQSC